MSSLIDMLFIASGVYLIFSACMSKKSGVIAVNIMLGRAAEEKAIEDKAGYIDYMYKRIIVAGLLIITAGTLNLINGYYFNSAMMTLIASVTLFAAIILYIVIFRKGQKRYMKSNGSIKG